MSRVAYSLVKPEKVPIMDEICFSGYETTIGHVKNVPVYVSLYVKDILINGFEEIQKLFSNYNLTCTCFDSSNCCCFTLYTDKLVGDVLNYYAPLCIFYFLRHYSTEEYYSHRMPDTGLSLVEFGISINKEVDAGHLLYYDMAQKLNGTLEMGDLINLNDVELLNKAFSDDTNEFCRFIGIKSSYTPRFGTYTTMFLEYLRKVRLSMKGAT